MFIFLYFACFRDDRNDVHEGPAGMEPEGVIESTWHEVYDNFDDMNLREELLRGIYGYGFEKPSAIQQRAIIPCVRGRDVIAQAQSGKSFVACSITHYKFCNTVSMFGMFFFFCFVLFCCYQRYW